jgi:hypothetical protein
MSISFLSIFAELIAETALSEKKWIQAFPEYGPERMGAPVQTYVKISNKKILSYSSIKLLNENSSKWFKQYIQGIRIDEYHDYFVVGKAFHLIVENYNKT